MCQKTERADRMNRLFCGFPSHLRAPYLSAKDQGAACYEAGYRERLVEGLRRRAKQLGLDVVPLATAP